MEFWGGTAMGGGVIRRSVCSPIVVWCIASAKINFEVSSQKGQQKSVCRLQILCGVFGSGPDECSADNYFQQILLSHLGQTVAWTELNSGGKWTFHPFTSSSLDFSPSRLECHWTYITLSAHSVKTQASGGKSSRGQTDKGAKHPLNHSGKSVNFLTHHCHVDLWLLSQQSLYSHTAHAPRNDAQNQAFYNRQVNRTSEALHTLLTTDESWSVAFVLLTNRLL